jgi:hypothetical protein
LAGVQVRWSGWHVGLAADGTLAFVGRSTEATGPMRTTTIDPALALDYLDRLVGIGVMTMDDRYRSTKGKLRRGAEGRVGWFSENVVDGGGVRILMVIGEDRNAVEIEFPMRQVPCGLEEWVADFKTLVADELFAEE